MAPRSTARGPLKRSRTVDPVPRYPTNENEMDDRDANRRQLAQNIGEQPLTQIHRIDVRASINCMICTSWRNNLDGCSPISRAGQPQEDHKTRSGIDIIACYQWPKYRITRLGSLGYRVRSPSFRCNVITSADRAPRADLRGLGPCSLQIVAIKMI